ncbi:hypothetical protein FN846DRAFT_136426 [Sphaerosporella brunnea]|uniref:Uncharacterized protein n=1 Tax=Sphaerosporella brunnea TaxID=1250544 RepID=A0A5J5ES87_9PEZI|nr:hypothetical protein FN846DRAFT_136426 [Sphaerosporella brunnea]
MFGCLLFSLSTTRPRVAAPRLLQDRCTRGKTTSTYITCNCRMRPRIICICIRYVMPVCRTQISSTPSSKRRRLGLDQISRGPSPSQIITAVHCPPWILSIRSAGVEWLPVPCCVPMIARRVSRTASMPVFTSTCLGRALCINPPPPQRAILLPFASRSVFQQSFKS